MNKISKIFALLLLFCAMTGWAQKPLLTSLWTQDYPYNQLCPRDPLNGNTYSAAGCPAIAMGQIINYLRTTQGTRFDDSDDYYHNYAGRKYNIDDDWESLQFPSFQALNVLLDSVDAAFQRGFPTHWQLPWFLPVARLAHRSILQKAPAHSMWIRLMRPINGLGSPTVCCFGSPVRRCMLP